MSIIHMETEQTILAAENLSQSCEQIRQQLESMNSQIFGLNWVGNSQEMFFSEFSHLKNSIDHQLQLGVILSDRVKREVAKWENADHFFDSGSIPIEGLYLEPLPVNQVDPNSDFGQVLGAIDPNGELNQKPGVIDWLKSIFGFTKDIFGEVAAKSLVSKWLEAFGTGMDGLDLITSSNEVAAAQSKYSEMLNMYGANDPQTLLARRAYSSSELEQFLGLVDLPVLPGLDFMAKLGGKWEILIQMYEQAKYEGPSLLDGMNIFNPPKVE